MDGAFHGDAQSEPMWVAEQLSLYTAATGVKVWFTRSGDMRPYHKPSDYCEVFRPENGLLQAVSRICQECHAETAEPTSGASRLHCPLGTDLLWAPVSREGALYGFLYTEPVLEDGDSNDQKHPGDNARSSEKESNGLPVVNRRTKNPFRRILRVRMNQRDGLLLLLELVAQRLACRFHEEERLPEALGASEVLVRRAKALLCCLYHDDVSTRAIADELHVSESHLCHAFHNVTGGTLRQHLNELRFTEACRLLREHPRLTIAEVAFTAGFQSLSRFSEQFRCRHMPSPGKWRRSQGCKAV